MPKLLLILSIGLVLAAGAVGIHSVVNNIPQPKIQQVGKTPFQAEPEQNTIVVNVFLGPQPRVEVIRPTAPKPGLDTTADMIRLPYEVPKPTSWLRGITQEELDADVKNKVVAWAAEHPDVRVTHYEKKSGCKAGGGKYSPPVLDIYYVQK